MRLGALHLAWRIGYDDLFLRVRTKEADYLKTKTFICQFSKWVARGSTKLSRPHICTFSTVVRYLRIKIVPPVKVSRGALICRSIKAARVAAAAPPPPPLVTTTTTTTTTSNSSNSSSSNSNSDDNNNRNRNHHRRKSSQMQPTAVTD